MVRNISNKINGDFIFDKVNLLFLTFLIALMIYPFIYIFSVSISSVPDLIKAGSIYFLPRGFSLDAYLQLLNNKNIPRYYFNTVFYAVASTFLMLIICILTAYPLSLKRLKGRKAITIFLIFTLFFNGGLVPFYLVIKFLGMTNSVWVMIIPTALNVFNIILFKSFFQQLPVELNESAHIDGANELTILVKIILPLSSPIIATFAIFGIVASWNDFFTALMFLRDQSLHPMQMLLRTVLVDFQTGILANGGFDTSSAGQQIEIRPIRAALTIVTILPVAVAYPFFQRYFVKGILIGSIKG